MLRLKLTLKLKLKKMINDNNIELYLFRYKEGLLDAAETAEVEKALASRPDWQELADLYDPELTLPSGATMPYAGYESLRDGGPKAATRECKPIVLRDATTQRRRLMPLWTTVAAAACLLLFVTTIVKFANGDSPAGTPLIAELATDSTKQKPIETIAAPTENKTNPTEANHNKTAPTEANPTATAPTPAINATQSLAHREAPTLLASADPKKPNTPTSPNLPNTPNTTATPSDSSVYDLDIPTLREVNDPMDQEVLYASGIIERQAPSDDSEPVTRRQQLRNLARRATTVVATAAASHQQRREAIEDAIEEHLENNELISNLIATLE